MNDTSLFPELANMLPASKATRTKSIKKILESNIVCADGLKYDYEFSVPQNNEELEALVKKNKNGSSVTNKVNLRKKATQNLLPF